MKEYNKIRDTIEVSDLKQLSDTEKFQSEMRSKYGIDPDNPRSHIEERIKSRRERYRDPHDYRRGSTSHEEKTKNEKIEHQKNRERVRTRADNFLERISKANFDGTMATLLREETEELHTLEAKLIEGREAATVDFEIARKITDKDKRRQHLDTTKARREKTREEDNVRRDRIRELRDHIEHTLKDKEREIKENEGRNEF